MKTGNESNPPSASPRLIHVGAQEPPTAVTACASERAVPAAGPSYALRG